MTLLEHLYELRTRLFRASLAIVAGMVGGWFLSNPLINLLEQPYCRLSTAPNGDCTFITLNLTDPFALRLKVSLIVGLIVAAPIWLYQLWAFIAPGLHRNERRWAYVFAGLAAPLFALGAWLAYLMVPRAIQFLLSFAPTHTHFQLDITRYFTFITNLILLFGFAFQFPLIVMLFNIAGIATAKRLLGWWRIAVFLFFAFSAVAIPTGDPFSMSALGLGLTALYFAAVGFAYFNDKRRERRHRAEFGDVGDDEVSEIDLDDREPVAAGERITAIEPVNPAGPLDRHYDDVT
jgi:sec-independent protein translocase protein TatC